MNPLVEITHGRTNPLVDPALSIWSWEIPVYLFLGGLAAGLLVLPSLLELWRGQRPKSVALRWAPLLALVLLSGGMVALFLDLEHKLYVWRFYLAFKPTSPMSWGSWILLLVYPVGVVVWLSSLTQDERARLTNLAPVRWLRLGGLLRYISERGDAQRRGWLLAALVSGVGLGLYTGLLLGTMAARPAWSTALLGPLFLTSGLSTGAALLLLMRLDDGERHTLVRWDVAAIVTELVLLAVILVSFASGDRTAQLAGTQLLGGAWSSAFWALVVGVGLAVPLGMELLELRRHLRWSALTPVLILVGGLSLRWILLSAGQGAGFGSL